MMQYNWPGNVRELIQTLERAIASASNDLVLFQKHLPTRIRVHVARASVGGEATDQGGDKDKAGPALALPKLQKFRESAIAEAEKRYLKDLLAMTGGAIQGACQISGLSRSRLYALLKKYNLYPSN
jgi:two-component system NtrC family response regulator